MGWVWHSTVHGCSHTGQPYRPSWAQNPATDPLPYQSPFWSQGSREAVGQEREMHIRRKVLGCSIHFITPLRMLIELLQGLINFMCLRPPVKAPGCPWSGGWPGGSSASRAVRRERWRCVWNMEPCPLVSPHPRSKHNPIVLAKPPALPLIVSLVTFPWSLTSNIYTNPETQYLSLLTLGYALAIMCNH